jgi:oxygen-independent coproporphyrinogen-3 oxidase
MRRDYTLAVAMYVHVPFCRTRCDYCDFNTYAGLDHLMPTYVEALCQEIEITSKHWGPLRVPTVYLGGGTPSLLSLDLLADLIRVLRSTFQVSRNAEITIEANPGTVTPAYLRGLRALGVNRLSLGAQSADDDELQMLGRAHNWCDTVKAIGLACEAGFGNTNLDLIFGLPGQAVEQWQQTLEAALNLQPEHLSLYDLSVEEGTPLAKGIAGQMLPPTNEDHSAAMYELAEEVLAQAGFFHYEISSWAKVDGRLQTVDCGWWPELHMKHLEPALSEEVSRHVCRHNLTYWRNEPWLGVGAGAHSWMKGSVLRPAPSDVVSTPKGSSKGLPRGVAPSSLKGHRWANARHPSDYIAAYDPVVPQPASPHSVEEIDRRLEMGETMMLGLRLAEGVRVERFEGRFWEPLVDVFGDELKELRDLGLLTWDGSVARLTRRGRLLGNQVFSRFI